MSDQSKFLHPVTHRLSLVSGITISLTTSVHSTLMSTPKEMIWNSNLYHLGVSKNKGTPKWMVYNGTLLRWMIWGYHYFWKHPFVEACLFRPFSASMFKKGPAPALTFRDTERFTFMYFQLHDLRLHFPELFPQIFSQNFGKKRHNVKWEGKNQRGNLVGRINW